MVNAPFVNLFVRYFPKKHFFAFSSVCFIVKFSQTKKLFSLIGKLFVKI